MNDKDDRIAQSHKQSHKTQIFAQLRDLFAYGALILTHFQMLKNCVAAARSCPPVIACLVVAEQVNLFH